METEKPQTGGSKKPPSPYDLNSNDNPGNVITQVQLRGENYEEWARAMKISLRARRKWGFIDGTHKQPDDGALEMEDWWTVQSMLVSWILNTIEPTLRSTVTYAENAKELWEDIRDRFSVVNGPRIQQLKAELADCKQQGMTMVSYYGKLKTLWDELANYEQIPRCSCGGCKCDIASKLEKRREEERVHQFLMGLDDASYGTVHSNILAGDPLPSLNRVYATLVQEERVKTISRSKEERGAVMGLAVQAGHRTKGRGETKDKSMVCSYCGKAGHDAKNCFQVIGYPEWWSDRPRNEGKTNNRNQQRSGTSAGHGRGGAARANAEHVAGSHVTRCDPEPGKSELPGLSNEQWQILVEMLNNRKTSENEKMTEANITSPPSEVPIRTPFPEEEYFEDDDTNVDVRGGTSAAHDETEGFEPVLETQNCTNTVPCSSDEPETVSNIAPPSQLGRGHRIRQPPVKLRDYVTNTMIKLSLSARSSATSHDSVWLLLCVDIAG
ncbi:Zinc finger, CCHC-type [Sesbania bispinosa]|nr:Zinc finger, CCHC-type [Sesbania bispinosa]